MLHGAEAAGLASLTAKLFKDEETNAATLQVRRAGAMPTCSVSLSLILELLLE